MISTPITIPYEPLVGFCKEHHIQRLALFGSITRGYSRPDSDIDLLVEFEEGQTPSLLGMAGLELDLTSLLGRKVDLRTAAELSQYFRDEVVNSAEVLYAGG